LELHKVGFTCLLIDLPGYGRSTIEKRDRVNPKLYKEDFPNMMKTMMEYFKWTKITGVGFCGGAAGLIRTYATYPSLFGRRFIFYNSVISAVPDEFEQNLKKNSAKAWCGWCPDPDHQKLCVGYKYFNKKRQEKSKEIFLQDLNLEDLELKTAWGSKMGRGTDFVEVFDVSKGFLDFAIGFMQERDTDFKRNSVKGETFDFEDLEDPHYREQQALALALEKSLLDK
jgi:hypothetical protein